MFFFVLLYLILTIIRPQDYLPAVAALQAMPVTLGLAFACWLGSSSRTFAAPHFVLLPILLLALMVSQVVNGWAGGAIFVLTRFGPVLISFAVLAAAMTTRRRVVITMAVIALCAMVLALHGVEQATTGMGWTGMPLGNDDRIQYVGIFNDPNDLGLLFVIALPMSLYLSAHVGIFGRIFWFAGALLLLYGVYLTKSRGTQLAVLVMGAVYLWRRRGAFTAGALSAAGLAVLTTLPSTRMGDLGVDEPSAFGRVDAWYAGLHMFLARPVFGIGAGNFTNYNDLTAHNSLILVLAETGFFGYTVWLAFVGYCFWMMVAILRHRLEPDSTPRQVIECQREQTLTLTLLLALCGFFSAAFFLSRSYTILLYLLTAVVVGYYVGARRRMPSLPRFRLADRGWRWLPISVASIAGLFVMVTLMLHGA